MTAPNSPAKKYAIMSSELPSRSTERLHQGRVSASGVVYFVTFVTAARKPWLAVPTAADAVLGAIRSWHEEGDGSVLAATVMPDHVHVLFVLGQRLSVGRCVSRWKAEAGRASGYSGRWQRDFWEHRVRADESWEDYGLYVFLNPYRAALVGHTVAWPWWWVPDPSYFRFVELIGKNGEPPPQWIDWPPERFAGLATGE
ncbi:MAG: transposase [Candidatus Didemnitutus sp.]|nr:transposase [Candidatus Didemnitutus sp.]